MEIDGSVCQLCSSIGSSSYRLSEIVIVKFVLDEPEEVLVDSHVLALAAVAVVLLAVLVNIAHLRGHVLAFWALKSKTKHLHDDLHNLN